jgi:hypothetical protein
MNTLLLHLFSHLRQLQFYVVSIEHAGSADSASDFRYPMPGLNVDCNVDYAEGFIVYRGKLQEKQKQNKTSSVAFSSQANYKD